MCSSCTFSYLLVKILIERWDQHLSIYHRMLCSKSIARNEQNLLFAVHIASYFTCVYWATAGIIFGTTDVYEFGCHIRIMQLYSGTAANEVIFIYFAYFLHYVLKRRKKKPWRPKGHRFIFKKLHHQTMHFSFIFL